MNMRRYIGKSGIWNILQLEYSTNQLNSIDRICNPNIYLDAVNLRETADYLMKEIHISSYGNRRQQHILR